MSKLPIEIGGKMLLVNVVVATTSMDLNRLLARLHVSCESCGAFPYSCDIISI